MNRQNLIDYLDEKEWINDRIKDIEERKELLNKLTTTYSDEPKGTSAIQDRVAEDLVKLLDETAEYEKILEELKHKQIEVEKLLEKMENKRYRNILYKKYIRGLKIEEIAVDIEQDYKYTCTLHGYALNEFDKICEKIFIKMEK